MYHGVQLDSIFRFILTVVKTVVDFEEALEMPKRELVSIECDNGLKVQKVESLTLVFESSVHYLFTLNIQVNWIDLPRDALWEIVQYLNAENRINLAKTCKVFTSILHFPISLSLFVEDCQVLHNYAEKFEVIEHLELSLYCSLSEHMISILTKTMNRGMRYLVISNEVMKYFTHCYSQFMTKYQQKH